MNIELFLRFHTKFGQILFIKGNHPALREKDTDSAVKMNYLNDKFWHISFDVDPQEQSIIQYGYQFTDEDGNLIEDGEKNREIILADYSKDVTVIDSWSPSSKPEYAFYTEPFKEVFFKHNNLPPADVAENHSHTFRIKAPLVGKDECVCLLGSSDFLREWNEHTPIIMGKNGEWWEAKISFEPDESPILYKYGIYNFKNKKLVKFEGGDNRIYFNDHPSTRQTIINDGFINLPGNNWKGAGVAIPVFSLRTENSLGVGEFTDMKLLADWAVRTGLKMIQILPINDTSATFTWKDSYPYAAISAFALHPIYINLSKVAGDTYADAIIEWTTTGKNLNSKKEVDYDVIINLKLAALKKLYSLDKGGFLNNEEYKAFFEENKHWLVPYAAFSYLRDTYKTSKFLTWQTHSTYNQSEIEKLSSKGSSAYNEIAFWYFVQFHLHLQLKEAADYAHSKGVAVKGDIPIGIFRNACDAWTDPQLYNMDQQAGAPPDDFAVKGQNWGFPTYNWKKMQENGFLWWQQRFQQMSNYFDAFRIDHILGFFRIWSIPLHAVEGIMGFFVPSLPVRINEFYEKGISFDYDRFCKPYITDEVLNQLLGEYANEVKGTFLRSTNNGRYELTEDFNTQRKVEAYFAQHEDNEKNNKIKIGLYDVISNVLLFENPGSNGSEFHIRISMQNTISYQHLNDHMKGVFYDLYVDYFYNRQDDFWKQEALQKLPALKQSTDMLICGEDLGMVPHCVPAVMDQLGILSLEIQRMPKNPKTEFFHPKDAPYLSVITPSTHDMSTIRGWWEEDRVKTQRFFNFELGQWGDAPYFCEPWVNRAIILQHLYSPAMWSIFQLQDILGMSEKLRRQMPQEERINVPAISEHYWNYRMHLTLEQLLTEDDFNNEFADYVNNSGRNK